MNCWVLWFSGVVVEAFIEIILCGYGIGLASEVLKV
jgi:hypothetical protein